MTIACRDCGALEDLPELRRGQIAVCRVCGAHLEIAAGRSIRAALACAASCFVLLFPANLAPFLGVGMLGMSREIYLSSGVPMLWNAHWVLLAGATALFAVVLPFVRFGLLAAALANVHAGKRKSWLGRAFRWSLWLAPWSMPEVFLIAAAIGYSRVNVEIPVRIGSGGYCFIAVAILAMLSRMTLNEEAVWRAIGRDGKAPSGPAISCSTCNLLAPAADDGRSCRRCGARLHRRKPHVFQRTLALVIASFVLYFPSNLYPMSRTLQITGQMSHTIFDGIHDLFHAGLAPLGVLIFCTSIAIPMLKLVVLTWLVVSIRRFSRHRLVLKTKLYRVVDEIGRWSNVDPFTLAVIVPLFQFPPLVTSHAGLGATAFLSVVVLTMIASQGFDARLVWDAAAHEAAPRDPHGRT